MNDSPASGSGAGEQKKPLTLWAARGVLALAFLVPFAIAISRIFYPFDLGHYESVAWEPARLIASGQNPYDLRLATMPPYVMSVYGPLYYALLGIGIKIFGVQFWFGRLLSLLAFVVCCFCIDRLISRSTEGSPAQKELRCLGVAVFCIQMPVVFWSAMHRADFLALAFGLCGLVAANSGNESRTPSRRRLVAAALCFAAAFFCRQTAILPFAFALVWSARRDRHEAVWLAAIFAIVVSTAFAVLQLSSNGGFAQLQWILPAASPRSLDGAVGYFIIQFIAPVAAMVVLLALIARINGANTNREAVASGRSIGWWQLYFLAGSTLAFVTSSRSGANINYWLEPCAVGSVLAAGAFAHRGFGTRVRQIGFAVVLVSVCVLGFLMMREERLRWRSLPYLQAVVVALQKHVPPDQPVASLFPDLVLAAGRTPWFNDPYQYANSAQHRRIFDSAVKSKQLGAILGLKPTPPGYRRVLIGNPADANMPRQVYLDVRED